jgi:hypothetical protein
LNFEPGHALANALEGEGSGRFAAVQRGQVLPHGFEVSFHPSLVLRIELLWESAHNRARKLEISCGFRGVEVHRTQVEEVPEARLVVEVPWRMMDKIRVRVTDCWGEPRLMLRQVRVFAWEHVADVDKGLSGAMRRIWVTLSPNMRSVLRSLVRHARFGPR